MKKDGFVSMTLVYAFLIVFLFLMLAILNAYSQQNRYKNAIDEKINLNVKTQYDYCEYSLNQTFTYNFQEAKKGAQLFTSKCNGKYKIELWGADGGAINTSLNGGKGAYTSGEITIPKNTTMYIYVGEKGKNSNSCDSISFNANTSGVCVSGGGATDIRLLKGTNNLDWSNFRSLSSRIMVAAGGGGVKTTGSVGNAGGLNGNDVSDTVAKGGAKTFNQDTYSIYFGATNILNSNSNSSGGGGGFFAGESSNNKNGGGGSSFISGHAGCIAVIREGSAKPRELNSQECNYNTTELECSIHYSGFRFVNTVMQKGGNVSDPNKNPDTNGNGYAKITFISEA